MILCCDKLIHFGVLSCKYKVLQADWRWQEELSFEEKSQHYGWLSYDRVLEGVSVRVLSAVELQIHPTLWLVVQQTGMLSWLLDICGNKLYTICVSPL